MENSYPIKAVAFPYGLFLAVYSILVLVLIYVFNVEQDNWIVAIFNAAITISIFVYAIKEYKKKNSGYLSLRQALKVGLAVAVVSGLIAAIYAFVHHSFIYPEFSEMIYDEALLKIEEQKIPQEQKDTALEMTKITTSPLFFATITLLSSLFFGFLISLITGLILKKENPAY